MSLTKATIGIALATAAIAAWAAPVGRVILSAGNTYAVREGREVRLALGSPIEVKDILRTGPASSLQVSFADESIKSLRENSELAVEEYQFAGAEDGSERAIFRLIKGGFRAVTGLIGRTHYANYAVRTPSATIGIRGTDYAVRECQGDCGADVKDGLYGSVLGLSHGTNQITLTNKAGEFTFGVSQSFYAPDANTAPQPLLQPPSFVSVKPEGKAQAAQQGGSGTGSETASAATDVEADSRPAVVYGTATPQVFYNQYPTPETAASAASTTTTTTTPSSLVTTAPSVTTTASALPSSSATAAGVPGFPVGTMTALAEVSATAMPTAVGSLSNHTVECDSSGCSGGSSSDVFTFDSSGFKRVQSGGFVDRNLATVSEVHSVAGVIEWGRWGGGPTSAGGWFNNLTFGANQGFHYVVGVPASPMPTSGTATFSLLGATTPTFSDGVGGGLGTGSVTSASATANFLSGTVTANMSLAFNGASGTSNYALAMSSGSFAPGSAGVSGFGNLTFGSGAVNVCPSACSANFLGFFAGANASHLGLGYDVTTTAPSPFALNGAVVMGR